MKLEFFRRIFQKYANTKFHTNPSSGSRAVQCGRTGKRADGRKDRRADKYGEANSRLSNFTKAPKNCHLFSDPHKTNKCMYNGDRVTARLRRIIHD
jgi:hypothetical protein